MEMFMPWAAFALLGVVLFGAVVLIASKLLLFPKDSAVNQDKYLGKHENPAEIYADAPNGVFYSPFNIAVAEMDQLLLIDIADDPDFSGIELQTFSDARGQGARVILYRHKGSSESYYSDKKFEGDKSEQLSEYPASDMEYQIVDSTSGLHASLKMKDRGERMIEFQVDDAPSKRTSTGFLAPVGGGSAVTFNYFPFFHMKGMHFVSRADGDIKVSIGGEARTPTKLPIPSDWQLAYLTRNSPSPILGHWNAPQSGPLTPLRPDERLTCEDGTTRYDLVDNAGHYEIRRLVGANEHHEVDFIFSPPVPDLAALRDGILRKGRFTAGADGVTGIVAGEFQVQRHGNLINMVIHPLEGWQPVPGEPWVRSWQWHAVLTRSDEGTLSIEAGWTRSKGKI
jgi:hypothetical protein